MILLGMNIATSTPMRASVFPVSAMRWMLPEFLVRHGLTAYKLARVVDRKRENTIYRLARDETDPSSVNFDVLKEILDGLRELTGKNVQVSDLISYTPDEPN
jgi:DNA-binding Xre family transcriptional regulator